MIPVFERITFAQSLSATALVAALLSTPTSAQDIVEVERDAVVEANRAGEISIETRTGPIAAPAGVFVAAPDEEIIVAPKKAGSPDAPKPPAVSRKKAKAKDGGADSDMERRLERIERMVESLAENDRMAKKGGAVFFDGKEFAKVQKDIDRATRDANLAMRKMHRGVPGEDEFVFEHKVAIAGLKSQRKALEAHRKALQKQVEALDKQLEALDEEARAEKHEENETQKDDKESKPELPPEASPEK